MFAYCVAAAYQEAAFRGASQAPRCASRRAPKGAVQERIHCLDDGIPVGTFGRQQQAAANKRLDFARAQFQPITAKAGAAALPVATHPLGGAGACDLGVRDNRRGDALVHRTTLLIAYSTAAGVENKTLARSSIRLGEDRSRSTARFECSGAGSAGGRTTSRG